MLLVCIIEHSDRFFFNKYIHTCRSQRSSINVYLPLELYSVSCYSDSLQPSGWVRLTGGCPSTTHHRRAARLVGEKKRKLTYIYVKNQTDMHVCYMYKCMCMYIVHVHAHVQVLYIVHVLTPIELCEVTLKW